MHQTTEHRLNKWKLLFFTLLMINILFVSISGFYLYPLMKPVSDRPLPDIENTPMADSSPFYIYATKENIVETVDTFLMDEDESFTILLDDYVQFLAELPLLGMNVSLDAKFEPIVEANGNLTLKQDSISFGILQIPNEYALQYMANALDLPDWVYVRPTDELIYLDLNGADFSRNFHFQFEQFDLVNDEIILQVYVND